MNTGKKYNRYELPPRVQLTAQEYRPAVQLIDHDKKFKAKRSQSQSSIITKFHNHKVPLYLYQEYAAVESWSSSGIGTGSNRVNSRIQQIDRYLRSEIQQIYQEYGLRWCLTD
jgi:hypothetical protein